ncbi:MAG: glycosyltransferase, partial [Thermodesulfovibrionales bacterium]
SLIELKRHKDALDAVDSLTEEVRLEEKSLELTAYAKEGLSLDAEAEVLADKLLSLNSQSAFALNLKGILSHKRGDKRAAEDFFQRSIENDPGYGEPCTNYGKLKWATQQDEALELLEKGFILSPIHQENATAYYNAVSSLKKFERAALVFEEAKALHPHNKRIRFLLIGLLIHHNDFNSAMQEIEDALILFGNDEGMLLAARQIREKVGPKEIDRVSQKRGTLSVCMIVKNEEQHIARSLHSLSPVADEFIVVDTGSMDKTADVARIFGAKVFDFTWTGNFAEARNFSLAQASGRWVLVHDADEVLSLRDHTALRAILLRETPRPKAYSVITRNYTMNQPEGWIANVGEYPEEEAGTGWVPTTKVRLFVNDPRIRFEGHVHECVEPSLLAAGVEIKNCAIPIHHYGRLNVGKTMAKAKEYYQLGIKKLEEGGEHPRSLRELAIQAGELGKHEEAIELWKRLINLGVTDETLITALFNTGSCYFLLGKYEDSLATSKRVMELAPRMKENILTYACSELCIGDVQKAIAALTDIAEQGTPYPPALAALMVSHMITGKKEDGVALMNKLHGMYVSVNEYLYAFAQYMKKAERLENAVILLEAAIETGKLHQDTHALLAECRDRLEAGNVSAHLVAQHNE